MENENKELVVRTHIDIENGQLVPKDFDGLYRIANIMANSGMVPKDYAMKPEAVFVAVQMGMEVGLRPMAAVQNIAVVNGKPVIYADGITGLLHASKQVSKLEEWFEIDGKQVDPSDFDLDLSAWSQKIKAVSEIGRKGFEKAFRGTFSVADAMRMGKWNKPNKGGKSIWQKYPARMLMWRARTFAARDGFSDVLKGLGIFEEAMDYEDDAEIIETPDEKSKTATTSDFTIFCNANHIKLGDAMDFVAESARVTGFPEANIMERALVEDNDFIKKFEIWASKSRQLGNTETKEAVKDSPKEEVPSIVEKVAEAEKVESDTDKIMSGKQDKTCPNCDVPDCNGCKTVDVDKLAESGDAAGIEKPDQPQIVQDMVEHLSDMEHDPNVDYVDAFYDYVEYVSGVQQVDQQEVVQMWEKMGVIKWEPYFLNWITVEGVKNKVNEARTGEGGADSSTQKSPDEDEGAPEPNRSKPEELEATDKGDGDASTPTGKPDGEEAAPDSFIKKWIGKQGKIYWQYVLDTPEEFNPDVISADEFKKAVGKWESLVQGRFTDDAFPYLKVDKEAIKEIQKPEQSVAQIYFEMSQEHPEKVQESLTFRAFANGGLSDGAKGLVVEDVLRLMGGQKLVK